MGKQFIIAHFIETDIPGGAEQVMLDICKIIKNSQNNMKPLIITFKHKWIEEQCEINSISYKVIPLKFLFKKSYLLPIFTLFFSVWLKYNRISLLHTHLFGPITGCAIAAYIAKVHHVATLHDIYMVEDRPNRIKGIQLANRFNTYSIAVSENMKSFYISRLKGINISVIYNGIDLHKFAPNFHRNADSGNIIIICSGRLICLKRVHVIIDAVAQLIPSNPNVRLRILGDGPELDSLKQKAGHLEENIHFLGFKENISKYLSESDIFVQNSTSEGLSRSIIEASSAGLPCVVSDVGGNNEIVVHEYNGFLTDGSVSQLVEKLRYLISNASLRRELAKHPG
jgi:glycosyltransferase involved in cell wall biosynthesis